MGPGPIYSQGFALLSSREEPCPLSLSHGFFTIQPSPSREPDGVGRRVCLSGASYADAEKSEFRRLNLQRSLQIFPKTFVLNIATSYHGNGDAYSHPEKVACPPFF